MNLTPQDYKITYFEAGNFTDDHGNTWCNVLFEGAQNEQIRIVVKDPSKHAIGQVLYGHIEEKMSKANKPYLRFIKDTKPEVGNQGRAVGSSSYSHDDSTQESIFRSVALKAAVDYRKGTDRYTASEVLKDADTFLAWFQSGSQGHSTDAAPTRPSVANVTNEVPKPAPAAFSDEPLPEYFPFEGEQYPL